MSRPSVTAHVIHWAARECTKQRSGEMSVAWMLDGWAWARRRRGRPFTYADVLTLGRIVEPRHNQAGVRQVHVRVGMEVMPPPEHVPAALAQLVDAQRDIEPNEWFKRYEEIHPFRDGNGRTGAILRCWLKGNLAEPDDAPDFWSHDEDWRPSSAQVLGWLRDRAPEF